MSQKILAIGHLLPAEMSQLEHDYDVVKLYKSENPETLLQEIKSEVKIILSGYWTPIRSNLIEALPNLELIAQFGVGTDNIDLEICKQRDISVTNTPDILTDETADTAMALLLSTTKRVAEADMYVRVGKWESGAAFPLGTSLKGKTVGIVGMGRIGKSIARKCEAFDMKILYTGPNEKTGVPYGYEPDLNALAQRSEVLILACSGNPTTERIIDREVLGNLGKNGILINISRGSVIDQPALVEVLVNRKIQAAGLDVYDGEPHVPDELKSLDNVVLLPHIGSATKETRAAMGRLVIDNIAAHANGHQLITKVV